MFKATTRLLPEKCNSASHHPFDAYIVLDFEATCERGRRIKNPEVIEFPLVVVNPDKMCIEAEFHRYVQPQLHPRLSEFCTELTGITQDVVDRSEPFFKVYAEAMQFLTNCGFGDAPPSRSYCMVTCGDWDLKTMLPAQFRASGHLGTPKSWRRWCNLKDYMKRMRIPLLRPKVGRSCDLIEMLQAVGLTLQGRHHSGIDDSRNIAAVLCELLKRGYVIMPTYGVDQKFVPWRSTNFCSLNPSGSSPLLQHQPSSSIAATKSHSAKSTSVQEAEPSQEGAASKQSLQTNSQSKRYRKKHSETATGPISPPSRKPPTVKKGCIRAPVVLIDDDRDAIAEILQEVGDAEDSMPSIFPSPGKMGTISRQLSYILRHGADEVGVPITLNGYVPLEALLVLPKVRREKISKVDVAYMVKVNEKQRFRLAYGAEDEVLYICATQGHSLEGVTPDLAVIHRADKVPLAVHGTNWESWRKILDCGFLSPMSRQYIHFAKGLPQQSGVISGMRSSAEVLLYLDFEKVLADSIPLFESTNGVILTPGILETRQLPIKYIKKVVNRETGEVIDIDTF